jgi:hypothetical protein
MFDIFLNGLVFKINLDIFKMRNIIKIDVNLKVEAIYYNTFNTMSFIYQKQGYKFQSIREKYFKFTSKKEDYK